MNKEQVIKALNELKKISKKRNFIQTYDLIINMKGIELNKTPVDLFVTLHHTKGKKIKVCALVGPELLEEAKKVCDLVISVDDFPKYQNKKEAKKLASSYDYFIAQATIMPKVATSFGRVFGPRGKMPNPKVGCVVPPNVNLKGLYEKLQKTVRLQAKNSPVVQVGIGNESMKDEEVVDNILTAYDSLIHHLPNGENNIKSVFLKLTMSKPVMIGEETRKKGKDKANKV